MLSLESCCDKELRKFPASKAMFLSRNEADQKFKKLWSNFEDPLTEVHIAFNTSALPIFTHFYLFLQQSDPLAHKLFPATQSLAKKIASHFIRTDILQNQAISIAPIEGENNYLCRW